MFLNIVCNIGLFYRSYFEDIKRKS